MQFKKPLFIQNINPRTIFKILILLTLTWILCRPLKGIGEYTYHLLGSFTSSLFQNIVHSTSSLDELIKSRELVNKQSKIISLLKLRINSLEDELKEVENLKNILKLKKEIKYQTIPSKVIGRTSDNWHKQIIINKGKNYNLSIGHAVLTQKGVVGQIVEVGQDYSIAQLISDPSYKLGCKVSKENTIGILSGKTNSIGLLEFIPIGSEIMVGDIVVTSGLKAKDILPTYPPGHPVGKIIKVSKKKSKASDLYIEVKLFEDLSSLRTVLVFSPQ